MSTDTEDGGKVTAPDVVIVPAIPCPRRMAVLQAVLAPLGARVHRLDSPDQAPETAQVVIVHTPPATALAHALAQGQDLAAALADWRAQSEALLAFLRRNRRRARILPDTAFVPDPGRWLDGATPPAQEADPPAALPAPDAICLLMAAEALRRDSVAQQIIEELEASATAEWPEPREPDLEAIRRHYSEALAEAARREDAYRETIAQRDAARAETAEAQAQASSARDEAARLRQDLAQAQEAAASARAAAEAAGNEAEAARAQVKAVEEEQEAVLDQLSTVQEKALEARKAQDRATGELTRAQGEITTLQQALSDAQQTGAENRAARERLEHQLHQLRQGLESSEAQLARAHEERGRLETDRRALVQRAEELAASLNASRENEARLTATTTRLEKELADQQNALNRRDSDLGALTARLVEREAALQEAGDALAEAQAARARLEREGRLQAEQAEELATRLRATHEVEARLHDEAAALQEALSKRDSELGALTARLVAREAELEAVAESKAEERRRHADALSAVRRDLQEREEEVARFYASKSYRITRPLRLLRQVLSRGK